MNEGVVFKETVVLRRWGSSIQKFGFINGVDNVNWPCKLVRWPIYIIDSLDKTKFSQIIIASGYICSPHLWESPQPGGHLGQSSL